MDHGNERSVVSNLGADIGPTVVPRPASDGSERSLLRRWPRCVDIAGPRAYTITRTRGRPPRSTIIHLARRVSLPRWLDRVRCSVETREKATGTRGCAQTHPGRERTRVQVPLARGHRANIGSTRRSGRFARSSHSAIPFSKNRSTWSFSSCSIVLVRSARRYRNRVLSRGPRISMAIVRDRNRVT